MANTTNKITMSAADIKTALVAKQTELDAAKNALQDALRCDPIDPKLLKECRDKATAVCDEWMNSTLSTSMQPAMKPKTRCWPPASMRNDEEEHH